MSAPRTQTSVSRVRRVSAELLDDSVALLKRPGGSILTTGIVRTPHGIVRVICHSATMRELWTRALVNGAKTYLEFIYRRRAYLRVEDRAHTHRGLAILAGRFARDCVAGRVR